MKCTRWCLAVIGISLGALAACTSSDKASPTVDTSVDMPAAMKDALLRPNDVGKEWQIIPPLKQEDKGLFLTCGSYPNIKQTQVTTQIARSEHLAGRTTPLIRPQLSQTIASFEPGKAAAYLSDLRACKSEHTIVSFQMYADETVALHASAGSGDRFFEDYIVAIRRGDALTVIDYSISQEDLVDPDMMKAIVNHAYARFEPVASRINQ